MPAEMSQVQERVRKWLERHPPKVKSRVSKVSEIRRWTLKPMSDKPTSNDLVLVRLSNEQIVLAKQANGHRRKITHALLCGRYGQIFGTEKHCGKYYYAWKYIFRHLFHQVYETEMHLIERYESTFNLVMLLIEEDDRIELQRQAKQGG
jgi:hypothetical protein